MALWGKTDEAGSKPKYLKDSDKAVTFGVSVAEAQQKANRDKGIKTPGFTKVVSYTDAQGKERNKAETLVAFGAGNLSGADAADDAVVVDRTITISAQPASISVVEGATATFGVTATVTPTATLSYQWQKQEGGAGSWTAVSGATSATYTTDATVLATDSGDKYRVVVSAPDTTSVRSSAATLTVTAA